MKRPHGARISRRTLIAGAGAVAMSAVLAPPARAQPDGFRIIRAREGKVRLRGPEGEASQIFGFEGTVPGPVLRVKRREEIKVRLVNELIGDATIHWHGVRVPNAMDGVPGLTQKPVAPGESFDCRFAPPDAGTFWYRVPIPVPAFHGLHGLLIVDETEPVGVDRDVALVLDAWPLGLGGWLLNTEGPPHLTVNGLPTLDIPVIANERVRLRLLNAADARFFTLRVDRHPVTVMAIDGQPAEPFTARESRITLAPGNRIDLFVDAVLAPGSTAPVIVERDGIDVQLARLVYDAGAPARPTPRQEITPLPPNPLPERMDFRGALRIDMRFEGSPRVSDPPLFSVKRGRTVMLAIETRNAHPYALHIHGHHVRLLDTLDDGWKPYWLDTIPVLPSQTARVAFVADNPGKWLLHGRPISGDGSYRMWFEVT